MAAQRRFCGFSLKFERMCTPMEDRVRKFLKLSAGSVSTSPRHHDQTAELPFGHASWWACLNPRSVRKTALQQNLPVR